MEDDDENPPAPPESLLPYEDWTEDALRAVMVRALKHVAAEGLPGEHHFYLTFRTDDPRTVIPDRLRAQYPEEMTIVLQHQFWDLQVDEAEGVMRVGLSFGGVPSTLVIPLDGIAAFADPYVRYALRFRTRAPQPEPAAPAAEAPAAPEPAEGPGEVVSLDAFRRRTTPRE